MSRLSVPSRMRSGRFEVRSTSAFCGVISATTASTRLAEFTLESRLRAATALGNAAAASLSRPKSV